MLVRFDDEDLLSNPEKRRSLEQHARQTVEQRFDWDAIALEQKRLYQDLGAVPAYNSPQPACAALSAMPRPDNPVPLEVTLPEQFPD